MRLRSVNTQWANHRPSGVDMKKIRHVCDNAESRILCLYQQLGIRMIGCCSTICRERKYILEWNIYSFFSIFFSKILTFLICIFRISIINICYK